VLNRFKIFCFAAIFIIVASFTALSQSTESTGGALQEARKLMGANKNDEALQVLLKHGAVVVPKYKQSEDSLVTVTSAKFANEKTKLQKEIAEKEKLRDELKAGNDDINKENLILTTNTILFFAVLIGVVIFILLGRFRVFRKSTQRLNYANSLIGEMQKDSSAMPELTKELLQLQKSYRDAENQLTNAAPLLSIWVADKTHPLHKQAKKMMSSVGSSLQMINNRLEPADEMKVETDLNVLIDEAVNQAYFSMVSQFPEFNCTVVRDLEKILPKIEIYPEDVRFVLFNLLENAFAAVWTKRGNSPKGYVPTVTISSRKLPRFIQVRVKDNGVGIPEKNIKKVFEPFFTERNSPQHPGLGLSESYRLITEKQKGELYIESAIANSTDFIMKFPTSVLM
jgi:signal transduction histidine kinase